MFADNSLATVHQLTLQTVMSPRFYHHQFQNTQITSLWKFLVCPELYISMHVHHGCLRGRIYVLELDKVYVEQVLVDGFVSTIAIYIQKKASMCCTSLIISVEVTGKASGIPSLSYLFVMLLCFLSFYLSIGSTRRARSVYHWTKRTSCKCLYLPLHLINLLP